MKAPEITPSITLPVRRKERSLSSLVVSTPRVSTQSGMTGRRSKSIVRKSVRSSFSIEKLVKKDGDSQEDHPESSSSPETLNKFTQTVRQVMFSVSRAPNYFLQSFDMFCLLQSSLFPEKKLYFYSYNSAEFFPCRAVCAFFTR